VTLDTPTLLYAYSQGVFPMAHEDGIYWYDPDPRAILPLEQFHVPRSLQRTIRQGKFEIQVNSAFVDVINRCASTPGRGSTWIDDSIVTAYTRLHREGFAHSVEAWQQGVLVGGLYGVAIRGLFAGESMFTRATDASKVCLAYLVRRMLRRGMPLLDVQFQTPHLRRFGVIEIPRDAYQQRLTEALKMSVSFAE
jgi:leucyl/phenylalanyl-tRNA--protein transferase